MKNFKNTMRMPKDAGWLIPGLQVKRWFILIFLGAILMGLGFLILCDIKPIFYTMQFIRKIAMNISTEWIAFAVIGWVPVWVPMVVVSRGIITDGLRSIALSQGYTAFGASTMMQNKICHFLTASRFSRALYGAAKSLVFLFLIIAYIPNLEYFNGMSINAFARFAYIQPCLITIADILVYVTVLMCIIRGVPVLIESRRFINNDKKQV